MEHCSTLIPNVLPDEAAELRWDSNRGQEFRSPIYQPIHYGGYCFNINL